MSGISDHLKEAHSWPDDSFPGSTAEGLLAMHKHEHSKYQDSFEHGLEDEFVGTDAEDAAKAKNHNPAEEIGESVEKVEEAAEAVAEELPPDERKEFINEVLTSLADAAEDIEEAAETVEEKAEEEGEPEAEADAEAAKEDAEEVADETDEKAEKVLADVSPEPIWYFR